MKLTKGNDSIKKFIEVDGLLVCALDFDIKETKSNFAYKRPKISYEVWQQVLSFMQWSFNTTRSEAQLRLFVNPVTKEWKAWAFPQIKGTGMETKEVPDTNEEWTKQRAQFPSNEGWLLFGTVHHHCWGSAFQSAGDSANEKTQDGLHITMGKIDEKKYDMHCRVSLAGCQWEPDMSCFYDIDPLLKEIPEWVHPHIKEGLPNMLARDFMTEKVDPEKVPFPKEWQENMKEIPRVAPPSVVYSSQGNGIRYHGQYDPRAQHFPPGMTKKQRREFEKERKRFLDLEMDLRKAAEDITDEIEDSKTPLNWDDVLATISKLQGAGHLACEIMGNCIEHQVSLGALKNYIEGRLQAIADKEEMEAIREEMTAAGMVMEEERALAHGRTPIVIDHGKPTITKADQDELERWQDHIYGNGD